MNNVVLIGRMVADPELKTTQAGLEVTNFQIAVDRPYQKGEKRQADFFDIVAWRQTAAFVCKCFGKGKPIGVKGSLQSRTYQAKDGTNRYVVEVVADSVEFVVGAKSDENNSVPPPTVQNTSQNSAPNQIVADMPIDDDLPF